MDTHPARGKIDLSWHKLAGLYHAPAAKTRPHAITKPRGETHRQIWRLVDGAVRDAFANHPDYLTPLGQRKAAEAITKRVTGTIFGYVTQVAQGRSVPAQREATSTAADVTTGSITGPWSLRWLVARATAWVRAVTDRTWAGAVSTSARNSSEHGSDG